jgi:hypothetical protein
VPQALSRIAMPAAVSRRMPVRGGRIRPQ